MNNVASFVSFIFMWALFGGLVGAFARRKKRSVYVWGIIGGFPLFWLFALPILAFLPRLYPKTAWSAEAPFFLWSLPRTHMDGKTSNAWAENVRLAFFSDRIEIDEKKLKYSDPLYLDVRASAIHLGVRSAAEPQPKRIHRRDAENAKCSSTRRNRLWCFLESKNDTLDAFS